MAVSRLVVTALQAGVHTMPLNRQVVARFAAQRRGQRGRQVFLERSHGRCPAHTSSPESIAQRPGWENLSAVKNGNVVPFNDDLASRPGPRLVDALEELAKLLRPELFQ